MKKNRVLRSKRAEKWCLKRAEEADERRVGTPDRNAGFSAKTEKSGILKRGIEGKTARSGPCKTNHLRKKKRPARRTSLQAGCGEGGREKHQEGLRVKRKSRPGDGDVLKKASNQEQ